MVAECGGRQSSQEVAMDTAQRALARLLVPSVRRLRHFGYRLSPCGPPPQIQG